MRLRLAAWVFGLAGALLGLAAAGEPAFRGVLLEPARVGPEALDQAGRERLNAVALVLNEDTVGTIAEAAGRVREAGMEVHYWIEIARQPGLAERHPEWMASLQGHLEWRRLFPGFPEAEAGAVVKVFPWVPVLYREAFEAHAARVRRLLAAVPRPDGVFLNDLQGAPSACGCGHPLCRWTADYGPVVTATRLGSDASARFVARIRELVQGARVIPVWATECEAGDRHGLCAGVECFTGACWKEWTRQLEPLAAENPTLGVLALAEVFQRQVGDGPPADRWPTKALRAFEEMPPRRGGQPVPVRRLIAVLKAWSVPEGDVWSQVGRIAELGAGGFLLARTPVNQGWEPRWVRIEE